ncbi:hypothetical protein, partial [Heyndrickxia coagulans]|uniref:hypothetical protein n=1 Tax=Heyndrickxia coagulans TaxID=1398 RepID=UPI001B3B6514
GGGIEEGTPNLERSYSGETAEILAKKAGISKTNMYYLLAVYRNRPDLTGSASFFRRICPSLDYSLVLL